MLQTLGVGFAPLFPLARLYLEGVGCLCLLRAGFGLEKGFMELPGDKVVADTVKAAVGCGNTPHHGGKVLHDTEQETGSSNALHDEPGK